MSHVPGTIIRFTYVSEHSEGDRFKEVMVLHPLWMGKLHGLDMRRMTEAERTVLEAIFDPDADRSRPHRLPLVNDILRRMDPLQEAKNPVTFYARMVKPFLRTAGDVYRTYFPTRMLGVVTVKHSGMHGQIRDQKSLFKAPLFKKV